MYNRLLLRTTGIINNNIWYRYGSRVQVEQVGTVNFGDPFTHSHITCMHMHTCTIYILNRRIIRFRRLNHANNQIIIL